MNAISSPPSFHVAPVRRRPVSRCILLASAVVCAAAASGCASASADKASATAAPAKISVVPSVIDFNSVVVGQKNSQTVRITNSSAVPVSLQRVRVSGSGFALSSVNTPLPLAPGKHANVSVVFAPSAMTPANGSLVISSPDLKAPVTVPLSGSGEKPTAALAASPASINFGTRAVKSSSSQTITLKNTGNIPFSIDSIMLTGSAFSVSGLTAGVSVSPGQSLNFQAWFHPTATGGLSTTVTISSAAISAPLKIPLSGSASTAAENPSSVSSHSVSLDWNASSNGIAGYHIYRGTSSSGPFSRISGSLISSLSYLDVSVQAGAEYFYVVTAVGADGLESVFSNEAMATIPSP
jgi:hypothetical protein